MGALQAKDHKETFPGYNKNNASLFYPLILLTYAPIPCASAFGVGSGCLNAFSQGIWSILGPN